MHGQTRCSIARVSRTPWSRCGFGCDRSKFRPFCLCPLRPSLNLLTRTCCCRCDETRCDAFICCSSLRPIVSPSLRISPVSADSGRGDAVDRTGRLFQERRDEAEHRRHGAAQSRTAHHHHYRGGSSDGVHVVPRIHGSVLQEHAHAQIGRQRNRPHTHVIRMRSAGRVHGGMVRHSSARADLRSRCVPSSPRVRSTWCWC